MALNFSLTKNHLVKDGLSYRAVVGNNETFDESRIVDMMIYRGSTVTKADTLAVLEEYGLAVAEIIRTGNYVNTSLFSAYPTIGGTFSDSAKSFNSARHSIRVKVVAGQRLKQVIPRISVQRLEGSHVAPLVKKVEDFNTGVENSQLTIGAAAIITGYRLKYDADDLMQGVFLINAANAVETRVERMAINKPGKLHFLVPASLPQGEYHVEVRTRVLSKDLRKGRLEVPLTAV